MSIKTLRASVSIFVFLLIGASGAVAQSTGSIAGTVTDASDGTSLSGANVVVSELERGTATANDGQFLLRNVSVGTYVVRVHFVGYDTETRTVNVAAGETARIEVSLEERAVRMGGVDVTALRPDLHPTVDLKSHEIREAEVADPGELLRGLPGVGSIRRGALGLDPNVRGLTESQVGVYVGGMRTFAAGPGRMDTPLSHVDPSTIKSIDVVKGPYALAWGPGNMSAIRVERHGETPPPTALTGTVHTGFDTNQQAVETTAFAMGRQGAWSYSANGAWRRGDDFTAGNGRTIGGGYTSAEGRGRVGVALTDASTLSLSGSYQNQDDIDYPGRMLHAEYFKTGMGQLKYSFGQATGTVRSVDARIGGQQTLHKMTNDGKPSYDMGMRVSVPTEVQNYNGRVAMDLVPAPNWRFTVGADVVHTYRDATRSRTMVDMSRVNREKAWPGVSMSQEGVFVKVRRAVGSITFTGTSRLDLSQVDVDDPSELFLRHVPEGTDLQQSDVMLNGAFTASLALSPQWTLSLGTGSVARPPQAGERFAERFPASKSQMSAEFQGTPSLDPERSTQGDVWLEGRGERWFVSINGFARRVNDYITFEKTDITPVLPMSPAVFRYTNGTATFFGSEMSVSVVPVEPLTLRASGSYLWGRDETLDEPAFGVAPPSADLGVRWSPTLDVRQMSSFYVDGTVNLTATQDRVARTRSETPTDGYTTVDLQTGVRLMEQVDLKIGVENLFDVMYTYHLNSKNPYTGTPLPEPGRVFTTNLTVSF